MKGETRVCCGKKVVAPTLDFPSRDNDRKPRFMQSPSFSRSSEFFLSVRRAFYCSRKRDLRKSPRFVIPRSRVRPLRNTRADVRHTPQRYFTSFSEKLLLVGKTSAENCQPQAIRVVKSRVLFFSDRARELRLSSALCLSPPVLRETIILE